MEIVLSKNLKFIRKFQGLNLNQFASIIGISKSSISDYENGKFIPNFHIINKYCTQFNIEISSINNVLFTEENINQFKGNTSKKYEQDFNSLLLNHQLLQQKLEGIEIQNKLLIQLMESKDSELKTLKIQVELLMRRS